MTTIGRLLCVACSLFGLCRSSKNKLVKQVNPLQDGRMQKKLFRVVLVILACAFNAQAVTNAPNIVLIISDDQSWTDYSFMGHASIQTPPSIVSKVMRQSNEIK